MKSTLTEFEIRELILKYQSELKKLNYQVDVLMKLINTLESSIDISTTKSKASDLSFESISKPTVVKSTLSSKKGVKIEKPTENKILSKEKISVSKSTHSTNLTKKSISDSSKAEKEGYKLSVWDKLVIESITSTQKSLTTYEIVDYLISKAKEHKISNDETIVKNKVVRSLQKLANRRNDIAKAAYKGKGYVYALPAWIDAQGKLEKKYK